MRDASTRRSRYNHSRAWYNSSLSQCGNDAWIRFAFVFNIFLLFLPRMDRGFGFITFRDPASVSKVLEAHAQEPIVLDEKNVR